jgi:cytochrome d ubiquinol oxidase subunit II
MHVTWFCLLAGLLAGYAVLDGYDIGAGMIHLLAGRDEAERRQVLDSIGPLWDGNEVWLVALGGSLFFAFPGVYAASFSGFYLPLMLVLWLLVFRGIAIELREHIAGAVWRPFWDVVFAGASTVLAFVYGVAVGNVVRGVPLDGDGRFFLALWTDFTPTPPVGIFDWYTVAVGLLTAATLFLHGTLWIAFRTAGRVSARARALAWPALGAVVLMLAIVVALTMLVRPEVLGNVARHPWGVALPALALGGLGGAGRFLLRGRERAAFVCSSVFVAAMVVSAAFAVFPYLLPAVGDPHLGLSVWNAGGGDDGLAIALLWWVPGMALATGYTAFAHWRFSGKVAKRGAAG